MPVKSILRKRSMIYRSSLGLSMALDTLGRKASAADSAYVMGAAGKISNVYAIEWDNEIRWYVDGHLFKTVTRSDLPPSGRWVFDHPFHILVNLAVGGDWPGQPSRDTSFPQSMYVDYVRVYHHKDRH